MNRKLFWHPESDSLIEITTDKQLERLKESNNFEELEEVTGREQFEVRLRNDEQDTEGILR